MCSAGCIPRRSPTRSSPGYYTAAGDSAKRDIARLFDRWAHAILYLNPDLAHVLPERARFVPYAHVDPRTLGAAGPGRRRAARRPRAQPTRHQGTRHVLAAVETLRGEGIPFRFELVEGSASARPAHLRARRPRRRPALRRLVRRPCRRSDGARGARVAFVRPERPRCAARRDAARAAVDRRDAGDRSMPCFGSSSQRVARTGLDRAPLARLRRALARPVTDRSGLRTVYEEAAANSAAT